MTNRYSTDPQKESGSDSIINGGNGVYNGSTESNKKLKEFGYSLIEKMSSEQRENLGSKSGTLHFVQLLGLESTQSTRTITDGDGRKYEKYPKPVGVTLYSDTDISVPKITILLDKHTGIDPEKDVEYEMKVAGEKFHLTYYEAMFLLIKDEYAGFCEANEDEQGLYLHMITSNFLKGKDKLPTPTLNFRKNPRTIYAGVEPIPPIKSTIYCIDYINSEGKWEIREPYKEKFGPLLGKK